MVDLARGRGSAAGRPPRGPRSPPPVGHPAGPRSPPPVAHRAGPPSPAPTVEQDTDSAAAPAPLTFGNIGLYDSALFAELPRGTKLKLLPLLQNGFAAGMVSGERYDGPWVNIGTPADLAPLDATLADPA